MKRLLLSVVAALMAPASFAAPETADTARQTQQNARERIDLRAVIRDNEADAFSVPSTTTPGGWIRLCVTELRYITFSDDYVHSGFAKTPADVDYYFAVLPSGIIMSPSSQPVLVPNSESFAAPATPDLWNFLRKAADKGKWVEFYAWAPNKDGVQRVTQVRRQYPSVETATCAGG